MLDAGAMPLIMLEVVGLRRRAAPAALRAGQTPGAGRAARSSVRRTAAEPPARRRRVEERASGGGRAGLESRDGAGSLLSAIAAARGGGRGGDGRARARPSHRRRSADSFGAASAATRCDCGAGGVQPLSTARMAAASSSSISAVRREAIGARLRWFRRARTPGRPVRRSIGVRLLRTGSASGDRLVGAGGSSGGSTTVAASSIGRHLGRAARPARARRFGLDRRPAHRRRSGATGWRSRRRRRPRLRGRSASRREPAVRPARCWLRLRWLRTGAASGSIGRGDRLSRAGAPRRTCELSRRRRASGPARPAAAAGLAGRQRRDGRGDDELRTAASRRPLSHRRLGGLRSARSVSRRARQPMTAPTRNATSNSSAVSKMCGAFSIDRRYFPGA